MEPLQTNEPSPKTVVKDNRIIDGSSWGGGYGGVCNNYLSWEIMSWKIGDMAVCLHRGLWYDYSYPDSPECDGPKYMEVNAVDFFETTENGLFLGFSKYGTDGGYSQNNFRKLSEISSELSEEILEKCLTTIEEPIEVC